MTATKRERIIKTASTVTKEGIKMGFKAVVLKMFGPNAEVYSQVLDMTVGTVFDQIWDEATTQKLSPREQARTTRLFEAAAIQIYSRLDGGKVPRDDGFFTDSFHGRTTAEELLEGVFIKVRDQYEERKIVHFGRFFGNIVFRQDIPAEQANFMLRAADSINYRQFLLLALAAQEKEFDGEPLRHRVLTRPDVIALRREEMELLDPASFGGYGFLQGTGSWTSQISPLGKDFYDTFGLNEIPAQEIVALRNIIEQCRALPIFETT